MQTWGKIILHYFLLLFNILFILYLKQTGWSIPVEFVISFALGISYVTDKTAPVSSDASTIYYHLDLTSLYIF